MQGMGPRGVGVVSSTYVRVSGSGGSGCSAREIWTDTNRPTVRRNFIIVHRDVRSVQATGMDQAVSALGGPRRVDFWGVDGGVSSQDMDADRQVKLNPKCC